MTGRPTDVENPHFTSRPITRLYGEKLRAGRKRAGLNQEEAARRIGVDRTVLSRWETGERQPTVEFLMKLAKTYGCTVSALMPRNQYPSAPLDPAERREFFWYRNARIQRPDATAEEVEGYVQQMRELHAVRAGGTPHLKESVKSSS